MVQVILENGRLQPCDILELSGLSKKDTISAIESLIEKRLIYEASEDDQSTMADRYLEQEKTEIAKSGVPLSAPEMKKLKARMAAERSAEIAQGPTGSKRKLVQNYEDVEKKVFRTNKPRLDSDNAEAFWKSEVCYRVNYEQFHIVFRNQVMLANKNIVQLAIKRLNPLAGQIVNLFLKEVESFMKVVKEPSSSIND